MYVQARKESGSSVQYSLFQAIHNNINCTLHYHYQQYITQYRLHTTLPLPMTTHSTIIMPTSIHFIVYNIYRLPCFIFIYRSKGFHIYTKSNNNLNYTTLVAMTTARRHGKKRSGSGSLTTLHF